MAEIDSTFMGECWVHKAVKADVLISSFELSLVCGKRECLEFLSIIETSWFLCIDIDRFRPV